LPHDAVTTRLAGTKTVSRRWIATGINADGKPEILGFDVTSAEDGHGRQPARRAIVQPGYDRRRLLTHCRSEPGFVAG
jgi:transposase-like protein